MRHAPAVRVLCSDMRWHLLQTALCALAAAVFLLWVLQRSEVPWLPALASSLMPALGVAAWGWRSRPRTPTVLRWDGASWWMSIRDDDDGCRVRALAVIIDVGPVLLLRVVVPTPAPRLRCLAVCQADAGAVYAALRIAAFARQADESSVSADRTT